MEINEYFVKLIQTTKEIENSDCLCEKAELSRTEFRLLREVMLEEKKGGRIISSELARRLGITRSAVSQIVTKLEKEQIVKRTASETDKKIAYVKLSDHALEIFAKKCEAADAFLKKIVERFGIERMQTLMAEFEELFKVMKQVKKEEKSR